MAFCRLIGKNLLQTFKAPVFSESLCRSYATKKKGVNYRDQCDSLDPKCGEKRMKEKQKKGKCEKDKKPQSMWLNPECCKNLCPDMLPRFDELYYKPSDKKERKYTQTWNECPEFKIVQKKLCCFENLKYPPMERRKKKEIPDTACPIVTAEEQKNCSIGGNKRCIKIRLPGCGQGRDPPKCFVIKPPSNCRKICTPYPAYSECNRPKPKQRHPVECNCLYVGPICSRV
ncbi:uncharacterized protein [Eurosta solidaginis]|uniref:uncharacterized protein n=1 Tax=Eurosta solidaginis TaxID=178769 RepID=UPI0035312AFF